MDKMEWSKKETAGLMGTIVHTTRTKEEVLRFRDSDFWPYKTREMTT